MTRRLCAIILAMLGAAALGGCAASPPSGGLAVAVPPDASRPLVLPDKDLLALGDPAAWCSWEVGRRDADLGVRSGGGLNLDHWVEIRAHDRRWTLNGRVHESSRTVTRTRSSGWLRMD
jgi:hypothetical protein